MNRTFILLVLLALSMTGCFLQSSVTALNAPSEDKTPIDSGSNLPTSLYVSGITSDSITLSWTKPIAAIDGYKMVYLTGSTPPTNCQTGTTTTLSNSATQFLISSLLSNTQYSFRLCSITNLGSNSISEGSFISATTLIAPPPNPISLTVFSFTSTNVILTWSSGGGSSIDYRISYQAGATAPGDCQSGTLINESAVSGLGHTVTGLNPGTQYSFRVCAINANATPDVSSGAVVSATTLFSLPLNPSGFTATPSSDVQISLSWNSGGGGTADYRISYQIGATAPANCASGTQISESQITGVNHNVSGLTPSTQYSFRVCGINNNLPIDVSSGVTATATTLATPQSPPPNPTGITNGTLTDTTIPLSWTSGGGTTSDYQISYQTGATAPATCAAGTTISDTLISGTTHSITGLTANTQYSFRVCAINGNTTPDVSSGVTITLTTLFSAPPNPTSFDVIPISATQMDLSWSSGGGSTSDYRISYTTGSSAPATCAAGTTIGEALVTGTSISVFGLIANTQYSFRVCAINANGTPDVSSGTTRTATTLQAAPPNVTGLTATEAETQIQLDWTSGGGSTVDYRMSYAAGAMAPTSCAGGTTISETSITGTTHTITGLTQGTQYSFRVCAINGNAMPDVSMGTTITVTTKILATGLRSIYTSEYGDGDFDFRTFWKATDSEIYGTENGKIGYVDAINKTYTNIPLPGVIGANPSITFVFKLDISTVPHLIFEIAQYVPSYTNYLVALNTQTKVVEILGTPGYVPMKIEFQGFFYFGYQDSGFYKVYRSDGTAEGTALVKNQASNFTFSFLNANSNFIFFVYDATATWDGEVYKMGPGKTPSFTQVSNICPAAACPGVVNTSSGFESVRLGEDIFFTGYNGSNSILYKTDGTTTSAIKNLGNDSVYAATNLRVVNSTHIVFDVVFDLGIWGSDGTAGGTQKLTSEVTSTGYFLINDGTYNYWTAYGINSTLPELWRTDGTLAGTSLLRSELVGVEDSFALMNGEIYYFSPVGGMGQELYKYNPTTMVETFIKDMNAGSEAVYGGTFTPSLFTLSSGVVLFSGYNNNQYELWKTDGTGPGTQLVKDINLYTDASSFPKKFIKLDSGLALFKALSQDHGIELWITDGTGAGTTELGNFNSVKATTDSWGRMGLAGEYEFSNAFRTPGLTANNTVPILYYHPFRGEELFTLDVTNDTFSLLKEFNVGSRGSNSSNSGGGFSFVGGNFFFPVSIVSYEMGGYTNGTKYWGSDGTLAGTLDVLLGIGSYFDVVVAPQILLNSNQVIIPNWVSDPNTEFFNFNTTTRLTSKVANVCPGYCAETGYNGNGFNFGKISSDKFAYKDSDGNSFISDGTVVGTTALTLNLSEPYFQKSFSVGGNFLFLGGMEGQGFGLFTLNPTTSAVTALKIFDAIWNKANYSGAFDASYITASNDIVYVVVSSWTGLSDLYISDGTVAGTKLIKSNNPANFYFGSLKIIENDSVGRAFFTLIDANNSTSQSLWITDPVGLSATKIYDSTDLLIGFSLSPVKIGNNAVYGTAEDKLISLNLTTLVPTALHTTAGGTDVTRLCYKGNRIYFTGADVASGAEIWYTDGTLVGTQLWQDYTAGANSSSFWAPVEVANKCYFWGKPSASANPQIYVLDF